MSVCVRGCPHGGVPTGWLCLCGVCVTTVRVTLGCVSPRGRHADCVPTEVPVSPPRCLCPCGVGGVPVWTHVPPWGRWGARVLAGVTGALARTCAPGGPVCPHGCPCPLGLCRGARGTNILGGVPGLPCPSTGVPPPALSPPSCLHCPSYFWAPRPHGYFWPPGAGHVGEGPHRRHQRAMAGDTRSRSWGTQWLCPQRGVAQGRGSVQGQCVRWCPGLCRPRPRPSC